MKRIDCCGMTCPKPVLAAKEAVERYPDRLIEVRVDNEASRENVARFFKSQGWEVSVNEVDRGVWTVTGAPPTCEMGMGDLADPSGPGARGHGSSTGQKILVFIPSNRMGRGDDELGARLMANFISTLKEMGGDLWRIVLVNSGVRLAVEGSGVLEDLRGLEEAGVSILVCGTCLDFYGLLKDKAVGETTNMLDIITSMQLASKVIRI